MNGYEWFNISFFNDLFCTRFSGYIGEDFCTMIVDSGPGPLTTYMGCDVNLYQTECTATKYWSKPGHCIRKIKVSSTLIIL